MSTGGRSCTARLAIGSWMPPVVRATALIGIAVPDEQRAGSLRLPSSPGFPVLAGTAPGGRAAYRRGTRSPAGGEDNEEDGHSDWPLQDAPGPGQPWPWA
jgi:hypothetical protein